MNSVLLMTRRALTSTIQNSTHKLRYYRSPPSSSSSSPPNNKLFVGGLSCSVDDKCLKDAFSSFGDVAQVKIIYDKHSGRSRGFAFVHFSKEDEAKSAKDAMDGKALLGRPLRISFALERVPGDSVVVPRLTNIRNFSGRNT